MTLYEQRGRLGGIVSSVIPDFRIDDAVIAKDAAFLNKLGVTVLTGTKAPTVAQLKAQYDAVVLAVGAYKRGELSLEGRQAYNALEFLEAFNEKKGALEPGKNVAVIGGGNTAMDTARAAKRCKGVEHVYLVYRRTKRYMPADEHELTLALADGVEFKELLAPVRIMDGNLICEEMKLGEPDASGRAGVTGTGVLQEIPADLVIAAVGEKVPADYYEENGIHTDELGRPMVSDTTLETNIKGVYVIGDGLYGPSLVVKAMAQAQKAAQAIVEEYVSLDMGQAAQPESVYKKKGILAEPEEIADGESERCLSCSSVCENCVDVCPNRANISIQVPGMEKAQILHVDGMCNECGNCRSFCPYASSPYLDKFTLFGSEADMKNSKNQGFVVLDKDKARCKVRFLGDEFIWESGQDGKLAPALGHFIEAVCRDYDYLLE